jgi:hypothetical protein
MRQHLEQRLQSLVQEYQTGQKMLIDLETKAENLRETLLRISGAIQVLEELLAQAPPPAPGDLEPLEGVEEAALISDEAAAPAP